MRYEGILKELEDGNQQFVARDGERLGKHVLGQNPKAVILTCSDSRVIPEKIFDQGIGDVFTIRVAGNVSFDDSVLQSIEYAVGHLNVRLIVIMGHTHCGAVKAAEESGDTAEGILKEIRDSFGLHNNSVIANVLHQVELLPQRSQVIKTAVREGRLRIQPAIYSIENGRVEFL
jgi:carbonic anhydrase